jgi:hypothetical protein
MTLLSRQTASFALLALLGIAATACPGSSGLKGNQTNENTVRLGGRVVDLESCYTSCKGVAGVRVSLLFDSSFVSEKTGPDGAFTLSAVPDGVRVYLLVTDDDQQKFLTTMQAEAITTRGSDYSTLELYAMRVDGPIYRAISSDLGTTVRERGIYIGQVLCVQGGDPRAQLGASVSVSPSATVRYVKDADGVSDVFYPPSTNGTGNFGLFVALGSRGTEPIDHSITISHNDREFMPVFAPLASGYIAVGTHRSRPTEAGVVCSPSDGGP